MKKSFYILPFAILFFVAACNNDKDQSPEENSMESAKKTADSLWKEIDEAHVVGMAKMQKLKDAQEATKRAIDSVAKIPAAAGYKAQLDTLLKDLNYADFAMEKWMTEFNADMLNKPAEEQVKYFTEENVKVIKMKEVLLSSLTKADSLLKTKF